jgi:O-acetyl-ADP-ribose deacetylase (regulator of RNase III)
MSVTHLILVDPMAQVCQEWETSFQGLPGVSISHGRFEELPRFDCMVSAANSFGLMDGGVDAALSRFFGPSLQAAVQRRILDEYLGEQPVGTSMIVDTGNRSHPFVAHTPTMRIPMTIAQTDNVYRAMWAMLIAVERHNQQAKRKIEILACPGLGTRTGRVPPKEAARQMAMAYKNSLERPSQLDWPFAIRRQSEVEYGGDLG